MKEEKIIFWSTLPGGRAISLATVNRAMAGNPEEPYEALDNKARTKKMENLKGEEFKRQLRISRTRQEDKESEERRKYIWRIQEELGAWEEKRLQMGDEMPPMERRERKRKRMEAPLRGEEMEVKDMKKRWKKGGAKW